MTLTRPKKTKRKPKPVKVKEGDLVIVTWLDAYADVGWADHRTAALEPAHCKSVGWVGRTANPETTLVLYADRAFEDKEDHDSNRRMAIPAGWITSIKRIKE